MSERKIIGIALVAVLLVTVLVYLPALGNGFVEWDDREYVFENPGIRSLNKDSLLWMFTGYHSANWHPLTWLSLALDYSVWGLNPRGYHLTNIILHAINTLLVVIMARMLFVFATGKQKPALQFAVLVGLFFGLHPIHVESVAWVSERKDLLYGMFYLLSIIFYLRYRQANHKPSYWLCLLMFIFSALSKPMAISLPLVLIALDYYPLRIIQTGWSSMLNSIRNKLPMIMVALALALVTVYVQRNSGAMSTMQIIGIGERLLVAQWALLFYLYKTLIPVGYIFLYLIPPNVSLLNPAYSIPLAINALVLVSVYLLRNKAPLLAVSAFIYLVTLLPVLGIVQVGGQSAADRYMYLTLLVPVILFAAGIIYIKMNLITVLTAKVAFYGVLSAILVTFGYLTVEQVYVWRNTVNLATHAIKHQPDHNHAYLKRADAHYQLGMYREVVDDMTRVIEINTRNPTRASSPKHQDYAIRGEAYFRLGMYEEAIRDYSEAIASNSSRIDYVRRRGEIFELTGRKDLALSDYHQVLRITPGDRVLQYKVAKIKSELDKSKAGEKIEK